MYTKNSWTKTFVIQYISFQRVSGTVKKNCIEGKNYYAVFFFGKAKIFFKKVSNAYFKLGHSKIGLSRIF